MIVASRERPVWLTRCLKSLTQQDYPLFEIVVVADAASVSRLKDAQIQCIEFGPANLAQARNIGVSQAGGDVCAFIDDDAVAEPNWLWHLNNAFGKTDVASVAGYVRGRNGISFQSRLSSVDAEGETHEEASLGEAPHVPVLQHGRALKLNGTNFAVRRDVLLEIGGFDENFRFFLEDSDLSFRLMLAGKKSASAPLAEVHHGFAASARRSALRAPRDLFDIGRSTAIYLRKHYSSEVGDIWPRLKLREEERIFRHLVAGTCEPRDVQRRLGELKNGWQDGLTAPLPESDLSDAKRDFAPVPPLHTGHEVLAGRWLSQRRALVRQAVDLVAKDKRVSVFSFSLTPFRHRVRYIETGVWLQTGGIFGRSVRSGPIFRWCRFVERLRSEIGRVAKPRGIVETTTGKWWDQSRFERTEVESEDTP